MRAGAARDTYERVLVAAARTAEPAVAGLLAWAPLRRALARRALRAWAADEAPLVVCLGNINRSPFAAALARARGCSHARSSGFHPVAGRHPPAATLAAASARGVDLARHRSSVVDDVALASEPAIFVFDLQSVARVAVRSVGALRRTHLLGAMAAHGGVLIADPHGLGEATLERVLDQIEGSLELACAPAAHEPSDGAHAAEEQS